MCTLNPLMVYLQRISSIDSFYSSIDIHFNCNFNCILQVFLRACNDDKRDMLQLEGELVLRQYETFQQCWP